MEEPLYEIISINKGGLPNSNNPPYWGLLIIPFLIRIPSIDRLQTVAIPTFVSSVGWSTMLK